MANPTVTTRTDLANPTIKNHSIVFYGSIIKNGWEVTAWGFYYYKTSSGIESVIYNSSDTDFEETIFGVESTPVGSLEPNTNYTWRARAYCRKWNEEEEVYDWIEVFGDWEDFDTHAYCYVNGVFVSDIDKDNGTAYFHTMLIDNDKNNCAEVGFEYGTSRTSGSIVKTTTGLDIHDDTFVSVQVTGLSLNQDFYVRAYAKSVTGHIFYDGNIPEEDKDTWLGNWRKFTTKKSVGKIVVIENGGYDYASIPHDFMCVLNANGQEINSWELDTYDGWYVSVSQDENGLKAWIGLLQDNLNYIGSKNLANGDNWINNSRVEGVVRGICSYQNEFIYSLELISSNYWVIKRNIETLAIIGEWNLGTDSRYGLTVDKEGYIYVINTATLHNHKIQKYELTKEIIDEEEIPVINLVAEAETGDIDLIFGDLAVTDNYVYAGAWFDLPVKANKDLTGLSSWMPPGNWHSQNNFFHVAIYEGKVLVEGVPDNDYSYSIALYDKNENLLWQVDRTQTLDGMSGLPYLNVEIETISAKRSSVYARTILKGELIYGEPTIRGFEYIIQDLEPAEEDEGTEILEEDEEGFEIGEYELMNQELYELENYKEDWEATTIWWFRAISYDDEIKYYGDWMKNVPTVETISLTNQLELNAIPMVIAKGQIIDKGANDITERGFRIIKEYKGNQWCMDFYIATAFGNFKVMEEIEKHTVLGGETGYEVTGYYWTGKFYRDSVEKNGFELGEYERTLGGGMLKEGFGIYLKQNDTYLIQAIARNNLGTGYGELREITTMEGTSVNVGDEQIGYNKFEKTVTLGNVPTGLYVTRIGIRLGRTKSCSELHYYKDGSFTTGNSVTFMVELEPNSKYYIMPYIVMDYGDYEEEILGMMSYTDPDMEDEYLNNYPVEVTDDIPEDELGLNAQAGEGNYSYRQIEKEIKCEKIGEQSLIDYYGRRRSYTVSNHLIQTKGLCCVIISDYLDKFQRIKLKVAVDIDMPIPFEEEDTILLGDGKTLFKDNTQGTILFKADGEGTLLQNSFILAKIRKIGAIYTAGTETIISLELEV